MPVPPIRPKEITPASRSVLMQCRHPPRRTSVVYFRMEELGGRRSRRTVADLASEGKRGCLIVCQKVQLWGSGGKARLSDCVSEGLVEGLRRESAVGRRVERLWHAGALSGTKARAGKRSGSLLSCV